MNLWNTESAKANRTTQHFNVGNQLPNSYKNYYENYYRKV